MKVKLDMSMFFCNLMLSAYLLCTLSEALNKNT